MKNHVQSIGYEGKKNGLTGFANVFAQYSIHANGGQVCVVKPDRGLGFKDFASFNTAILAMQFWRLVNSPNALRAEVLKGIYFPNYIVQLWKQKEDKS